MSELTQRAYDETKHSHGTATAKALALIAIAEALERIAAVKEREQAEDSRRRASHG